MGAGVLLLVAAFLVFGLDDDADDDSVAERASEVCAEFSARVQRELELSFPEGVPTDAAAAEYLGRAFVDTMDELVVDLRALEPEGEDAAAIDALAERIAEVRASPEAFVADDPFQEVAARLDAQGMAACGSAFFPGPE